MESHLTEKITWIKGLALHCPMGHEDPSCPFFKMRSLPVKERMQLLDEMGIVKIMEMADYHEACLRQKEAEKFYLN